MEGSSFTCYKEGAKCCLSFVENSTCIFVVYARAVLDDLVLCSLKLLDFVLRVALVATNASLLLVSEHSC